MGNLTSRQWAEMTELQEAEKEKKKQEEQESKERRSFRDKLRTRILRNDPRSVTDGMERTPIAIEKTSASSDCDTPVQSKMKLLSLVDPRSPGGGVTRTPIVVEEGVRRRVLGDDEMPDTPLRGQVPPAITIPSTTSRLADDRSPVLIETAGEGEDPRSPSTLNPRTPITSTPVIDLISRPSNVHSTPATIDLEQKQEEEGDSTPPAPAAKERKTDRSNPAHILQNKFKSAVASMQNSGESPLPVTPPAADELESPDVSIKSGNDSSLVI